MLPILGLGFFLGLSHALEADHLAAVATLASQRGRAADIVKHGLTWGLGHTLTLLALAGAAFVLGGAIPDSLAQSLEVCVGAMLVGLGGHLLYRLWKARLHVHAHQHRDGGAPHLHVHSHAGEPVPHVRSPHAHAHGFRWRTLLVGLVHGMAGSGALLLLAMAQVRDPLRGLAYILTFGVGSMIGMGLLSAALAVPLALSARFLTWGNRGLQLAIGVCTIVLGVKTVLAHLT